MSEKSSSSGSDEDIDPESAQPVEFGGVLSKVSKYDIYNNETICIIKRKMTIYMLKGHISNTDHKY